MSGRGRGRGSESGRGSGSGRVNLWIKGARPRTLPAALVPVALGTAIGHAMGFHSGTGGVIWWRALCAMIVALSIQVGTNYANDYSDGVRGTDDRRVGPLRLVAGGQVSPTSVKMAAIGSFGVAGVAGLALAAVTTWWLVPIGLACFVAGWLYTGGPKPYGYYGWGELFVFVFFGVVATLGSTYVQYVRGVGDSMNWSLALVGAIPVGLLATALLEANNLRDIDGDKLAGKKTLAVRVGRKKAGWLYVGSLLGVVIGIGGVGYWHPWALIALLGLVLAWRPLSMALSRSTGSDLLPMLAESGRLQLAVGLLLTLGMLL